MNDEGIIELFFQRSEQALTETQRKYGELCGRIAGGILRSPQDAEEAVSTSYMKLWNAIPPKRPQSLCGYLCRIVRNTAFTAYQRIRRYSCEEQIEELEEIIPDTASVECRFESRQIAGFINDFLGESVKKSRDIFVARYYYNMSIKDIAERLSMSEGAVKTRLSRTREQLRSYLTERGVEL